MPRLSPVAREVEIILPRPHKGQLRIIECPARFRVVRCGRRFGKTTLGIIEAVQTLLAGGRVGWFEPTYKLLEDVWRELTQLLQPAAAHISVQEHRIALVEPGGILECWSADGPDPGRGRSYDKVIFDEAGICANLAMAWQGAIRPTLADRKGSALILGTGKAEVPFFHDLFELGNGANPEWRSFQAASTDNPYLDAQSEIDEARRAGTPEWIIRQEWYGERVDGMADAAFDLQGLNFLRERMKQLEDTLGTGEVGSFELDRRVNARPVLLDRRA